MTSYAQLTDRFADRVVAGIKRVEGVVSSSTTKVTTTLAAKNPAPALTKNLPLRGTLPSARDIAAANFTVLERIVSAQKEYALTVLSPAAPAKPAPRPAAAKATTKLRAATRKTS